MEDLFTRLEQGPFVKKRRPLSEQVQTTITTLVLTLGVMIAALSGAFLYFSSMASQKGNLFDVTRSQNEKLRGESDDLEQKLAEASAQEKIKEDTRLKTMTKVEYKVFVPEK